MGPIKFSLPARTYSIFVSEFSFSSASCAVLWSLREGKRERERDSIFNMATIYRAGEGAFRNKITECGGVIIREARKKSYKFRAKRVPVRLPCRWLLNISTSTFVQSGAQKSVSYGRTCYCVSNVTIRHRFYLRVREILLFVMRSSILGVAPLADFDVSTMRVSNPIDINIQRSLSRRVAISIDDFGIAARFRRHVLPVADVK